MVVHPHAPVTARTDPSGPAGATLGRPPYRTHGQGFVGGTDLRDELEIIDPNVRSTVHLARPSSPAILHFLSRQNGTK